MHMAFRRFITLKIIAPFIKKVKFHRMNSENNSRKGINNKRFSAARFLFCLPPSEREVDFASQKTEGACESLIDLVFAATKITLHAGSSLDSVESSLPEGALQKSASKDKAKGIGTPGRSSPTRRRRRREGKESGATQGEGLDGRKRGRAGDH